MITVDEVRDFALSMPEAEEHDHWGKPSFRVRNKIFAVIQEDGLSLVVKSTKDDRLAYNLMDPVIYRLPEKFTNLNYMIVRIDLVNPIEWREVMIQAWRCVAPKKIVSFYDSKQ